MSNLTVKATAPKPLLSALFSGGRDESDLFNQQSAADRSLDQWRGLALILVLISHGFLFTGHVPGVGRAGVNLFFFISGLLVFRSLARGPQQLWPAFRYFEYRRFKRLIPAKYFYLFVIALILVLGWPLPASEGFRNSFFHSLPSAFLYYRNYYNPPFSGETENLTGHLWSLACEMQFYIVAPFIFFAGGKSTIRRMLVFGGILMALLAGGLSGMGKTDGTDHDSVYTFGVAAWPMMAGFFMEFLRWIAPGKCGKFGKLLVWCGVLGLVMLVPAVMMAHKKAVILAGTLLIAGCLGCYLEGLAPRGGLGRVLHFLGNRTYSIYLWQQPLTIGGWMPAQFHALGCLLSIGVGTLAFHFLERPFMSKFQPRPPKEN